MSGQAQPCSATTQAAYLLLTLYPYVTQFQIWKELVYERRFNSIIYRYFGVRRFGAAISLL